MDDNNRAAHATMLRSIAKDKPVTFVGTVGSGKTALMAEIDFWTLMRTPRTNSFSRKPWLAVPNYWTTAEGYCSDLKDAFAFEKRFSDWSAMNSPDGIAKTCKRLFLDDLGVERTTEFNTEAIYSLLNDRDNAGLPTWITTNLMPKDFIARYGERLFSRLRKSNAAARCEGTDRRMAVAAW